MLLKASDKSILVFYKVSHFIIYNNLLKRILFPSLSIYFFPSPDQNFGALWEKMGIFSILKIESLFPSLFICFFPIFAHPQIQISVCLGQKWGWTPPHTSVYFPIKLFSTQVYTFR